MDEREEYQELEALANEPQDERQAVEYVVEEHREVLEKDENRNQVAEDHRENSRNALVAAEDEEDREAVRAVAELDLAVLAALVDKDKDVVRNVESVADVLEEDKDVEEQQPKDLIYEQQ